MTIERDLIRRVRTLDEYDLRRLLIYVRGLLVQHGADAPEPEPSPSGKISYRLESVSCGKAGCTKCPHGPYWYAYWREAGRVKSRYIGKQLPSDTTR